jgi:hypothetical protein
MSKTQTVEVEVQEGLQTVEVEVQEGLSDKELMDEQRAIQKIKDVPIPPIDGDPFTMCGQTVIVPPLKVKHLVKYAKDMQKLAGFNNATPADEAFTTALPIIHAALCRNYPTLTTDDVMELLDVSILSDVTLSIMGRSGYKKLAAGESPQQR